MNTESNKNVPSLVHNHIVIDIITRHAHRPGVVESFMLTEYEDMMKKSTDVTTGLLLEQDYYYAEVNMIATLITNIMER